MAKRKASDNECSKRSNKPKTVAAAVEEENAHDDGKAVAALARAKAGVDPLDAASFMFFIISKGRPANVATMARHFAGTGVAPTWIVGDGEAAAYSAAGATHVVEGGKLTPSRNMALEGAEAVGKVCVQLSDDLDAIWYLDSKAEAGGGVVPWRTPWRKPPTQARANALSYGAAKVPLSAVGGARLLEALLRSHGSAKLAGVYPLLNAGFAMNQPPVGTEHFIVGDFIVVDTRKGGGTGGKGGGTGGKGGGTGGKGGGKGEAPPPPPPPPRPLRFDERFRLKEDYDFSAQHLTAHGAVVRANRLFVKAAHGALDQSKARNSGGAVAERSAALEKASIKLLRAKWPGVFRDQRRKHEVIMVWRGRKPCVGVLVAKAFDGAVHHGEVTNFLPPLAAGDEALWRVSYEDGDAEDVGRAELEAMADLGLQTKGTKGTKQRAMGAQGAQGAPSSALPPWPGGAGVLGVPATAKK